MISVLQEPELNKRIDHLISLFGSTDGAERQRTRKQLVAAGISILPVLVRHLEVNNDRVRWEVAKTLEELKDPSTAPALVSLLRDEVPGIRWLAGQGLVNLREDALIPLLKGLQVNFHSRFFREGAHHVLRELERERLLNEESLEALQALEGTAPAVSVPFAAAAALKALRGI